MGANGPHYLYIIRSVRMVYYAQCVFVQEEHTIWPTGRRARYSRRVSGVVTHKKKRFTLRITMSCVSYYEMILGNRFISRFAPG